MARTDDRRPFEHRGARLVPGQLEHADRLDNSEIGSMQFYYRREALEAMGEIGVLDYYRPGAEPRWALEIAAKPTEARAFVRDVRRAGRGGSRGCPMSARCACPYHNAPCANAPTATTARYGPLCGQCRAHLAEAWRSMGLGEWMLDVKDDGTVAGGREIWRQGRKAPN